MGKYKVGDNVDYFGCPVVKPKTYMLLEDPVDCPNCGNPVAGEMLLIYVVGAGMGCAVCVGTLKFKAEWEGELQAKRAEFEGQKAEYLSKSWFSKLWGS